MFILVWLIVSGAIILLFVLRRFHQLSYFKRLGYPGPKPHFIFGNVKDAISRDNARRIESWREKFGKIFGFYFGGIPVLCVTDEELMKRILITDSRCFGEKHMGIDDFISTHADFKGNHIFNNYEKWSLGRKFLTPLFGPGKVREYFKKLDHHCDLLLKKVISDMKCKDYAIDLKKYFSIYFFNSIPDILFGLSSDSLEFKESELSLISNKLWKAVGKGLAQPVTVLFPEYESILYPVRVLADYMTDYSEVSEYFWDLISYRRADRPKNGFKHADFLQTLIESKYVTKEKRIEPVFDICEMIGNSIIYTNAATDTTSSTLGTFFHVLCCRQDLQDAIRAEVVQTTRQFEGIVTYEALREMPLLEATLYETMRFYPACTNFVRRSALVDYEFNGRKIPKGTSILVPIFSVNRNPEFWENADQFDETRFLKDKTKTKSMHFLSFGYGPHGCPGTRLAVSAVMLTAARLLMTGKFELFEGPVEYPPLTCTLFDMHLRHLKVKVSPLLADDPKHQLEATSRSH